MGGASNAVLAARVAPVTRLLLILRKYCLYLSHLLPTTEVSMRLKTGSDSQMATVVSTNARIDLLLKFMVSSCSAPGSAAAAQASDSALDAPILDAALVVKNTEDLVVAPPLFQLKEEGEALRPTEGKTLTIIGLRPRPLEGTRKEWKPLRRKRRRKARHLIAKI